MFEPKVKEITVQRKYYILHSLLFVLLFTKYWPASVIIREFNGIDTSK